MKRPMRALLVLGAVVASFAIAAWAAGEAAWNHDPGSAIGPAHWGTIDRGFATCGTGASQSPVDISGTVKGGGPSLQFRYPGNDLVVENTGHVVEVPLPTDNGNTLKIGSSTYTLVQYHFHVPSEHTLNGKRYDMEVHLVHQNAAGETVVVAVFMNIGDHPNGLVDDVFHNAPDVADEETDVGVESNADELLPGYKPGQNGTFVITRYYTYSGSLTTPPCSEPVRWFVLKDPVNVSDFSVSELHHLVSLFPDYGGYPNNNRPVQSLNGREIISRG